jgi:hypothetical protein
VSAKLATGDAALALNGDQWLALAGVFSGVLVGGGSLVFAYFNGRSERQHGERLARSSRLHDQRFAAYKEIARLLERQRLYLTRTEPFIGPKPDPPPPLDDEEWAGVSGLAAISPSQDALTALENASQKTSDFEIAVFTYRQINARPAAARVDEDPDEELDARRSMDAARNRALEAISEAQRTMREELAEL